MEKPVVFIAGPFRAETPWEIEQNIRVAEEWALKVWKAGGIALCPHCNTRHFQGELPDSVWLEGALGTKGEIARAIELGIDILAVPESGLTIEEVAEWLTYLTPRS